MKGAPTGEMGWPIQRDTGSETIVQFEDPLCPKAGSTAGNLREDFDYENRSYDFSGTERTRSESEVD